GFHCFLWGSVASVLYAAPTNPDRSVTSTPARVDASAAVAQADATPLAQPIAPYPAAATPARLAVPLLQPRAAAPLPDAGAAEPAFKLAAVTPPDANVSAPNVSPPNLSPPSDSPPEPTDECLLAQDCIDQYLWSLYE